MNILFLITFVGFLFFQNAVYTESYAVMSIDLGSEWLKIAIVKPGVPMEIVLNKESKRKTEVAVSMRNEERVFGSSAVSKGVRFPASTYMYLQDLLGKSIDNPLVQEYQKRFPYYKIKSNDDNNGIYFIHDEEKNILYTPEELMAMVLNHSRSLAEDYAQTSVDSCVLTVPSYYTQNERKSLLYSAKLAGLKVSQLMDTDTAAALNYGVFRRNDINQTASYLMLYDMGATSTIASIISYQLVKVNGVTEPQLSVKGVGFDRSLGGLEMDLRLRDHLVQLFNENKKTSSDVTKNPRAMAKLLKEAKRVKKVLSANADHMAQIEGLIDEENFRAKVTREDFEKICSDLWERVSKPMQDAVEVSEIPIESINQIILVGGGTRVPKVQEILLKTSGKSELGRNLNADEAPALGASYQAATLSSGFRVKPFHVKGGTIYPIEINFQREVIQEDGSVGSKNIRRTLFQRSNSYPQRKVITFNRFVDNFNFYVNYGDLDFLGVKGQKIVAAQNISKIELDGVKDAHLKYENRNNTESKGVKAHFRMDESGILNLESVEAVYEGNRTENVSVEKDKSTFEKIKSSLSNLFGGNEASDELSESEKEEKKSEEEKEEKEDPKKEEETKEEEIKYESKIVKFKESEAISSLITFLDHKEPLEESTKASSEKLQHLADIDAYKLAREVALNKLETYIYDKRDKLYSEEYENALNDEERTKITEALSEASDWLDYLEGEPAAEVYNEKRKDLQDLTRSWLLRVKQRREAEPLLKELENLFNHTNYFLHAVKQLQDDLYTKVEVETLEKIFNETKEWKNSTLLEESALKPYQDPVLKPADLKLKMGALNREIQYLINKAKTAKPKTKSQNTNETTTEEKKTTSENQEPSIEEPSTKEPATEEPSTKEPSTKEPATEEPSTNEPSTKEPATEEPAVVEAPETATDEPETEDKEEL